MKLLLIPTLFLVFAGTQVFAQAPEEQGAFDLNQNPLEPGQAPVHDPRLAPSKETGGIILQQETLDLPKEAAIVFAGSKKKSPISKDFIFGFISGSILVAFVSFFMLKFAKKSTQ